MYIEKHRELGIFYKITFLSLFYVCTDIYTCLAVFKQQRWNLLTVHSDPTTRLFQHNIFWMLRSELESFFYVSTMKKAYTKLPSHTHTHYWQFSWKNSLAVLTEVHLGPSVYAGLTLKCGYKLDPLATKRWKNLSVRMSLVCIIIVRAAKRKKKRKWSGFSTRFLHLSTILSTNHFLCYQIRARKITT